MNPRGVTLVELLAAISIMVVVTALALPALQNRLSAARLEAAQGQLQAAALATRADAMRQGRSLSLHAHPTAGGDVELLIAPLAKPDASSNAGPSSETTGGAYNSTSQGTKWVTLGAPIKFNPQPPSSTDKTEHAVRGSGAPIALDVRLAIFCPDGSAVTSPVYLTDGETVLIVTVNPWIGGVKFAPFIADALDKASSDQSETKSNESPPPPTKGGKS